MSNLRSQDYPQGMKPNRNPEVRPGGPAVGFTVEVIHQPGTPFGLTAPDVHVVATCNICNEPLWPATGPTFVDHARIHEPGLGR